MVPAYYYWQICNAKKEQNTRKKAFISQLFACCVNDLAALGMFFLLQFSFLFFNEKMLTR